MGEIFVEQWTVLVLGVLAITFNMYAIAAGRSQYVMGNAIRKYGAYIEFVNWLVFLGVIIYLGFLYTWWFLLSFWVFPAVGGIMASILRGFTQLAYIFGMPIFIILVVIHLAA